MWIKLPRIKLYAAPNLGTYGLSWLAQNGMLTLPFDARLIPTLREVVTRMVRKDHDS